MLGLDSKLYQTHHPIVLSQQSSFDHIQLANSGIKVTYRGINTNELTVTFPQDDITISGTLYDKTQPGRVWLYAFPESITKTSNLTEIPQWIKNNAAWWSEGTITDLDFLNGIEFLIQNNILKIQGVENNTQSSEKIPLSKRKWAVPRVAVIINPRFSSFSATNLVVKNSLYPSSGLLYNFLPTEIIFSLLSSITLIIFCFSS